LTSREDGRPGSTSKDSGSNNYVRSEAVYSDRR